VNGLNDALQTNRAGFIADNPVYINFQGWLRKTLNKLNTEMNKEWMEERKEVEKDYVKETLSRFSVVSPEKSSKLEEPTYIKEKQKEINLETNQIQKREVKPSITHSIHQKTKVRTDDNLLSIQGHQYNINVEPLGFKNPEAVLDKQRNSIVINSLHPLYELSRTSGGIWGVQYHAIRAAIVVIALESSCTLDEFKDTYYELIKECQKVARNIQKRIIKP
jgi:hypothetical protein